MQIKSIILYNKKGERRIIPFRRGNVNIITGDSKTGKTTLLHIIDYCMGRTTFNIPIGPIRQSVIWYAVIFYLNEDEEIIIARPRPAGNARSSSEVYYRIGQNIEPPPMEEFNAFANDKSLVELLSRRIGISPNRSGESVERQPFEATFEHTKFYLFQTENDIKNPSALFYRQGEEGLAKHIRSTLPFILGAVQEDSLRLENEIRDKSRHLIKLKGDLRESEDLNVDRANRAQALLVEAIQAGLIDLVDLPTQLDEVLRLLKQIVDNWQPYISPAIQRLSPLSALKQQESDVNSQIYEKHEQLRAAEEFTQGRDNYSREASQQVARLVSIGLFDEDDEEQVCPICSSHLQRPIVSVSSIRQSLEKLYGDLRVVRRDQPHLDEYIQLIKRDLTRLYEQRRQLQLNIQAAVNEREASTQLNDDRLQAARVVGRLSQFIETTPRLTSEIVELRRTIDQIEREIASFREQLDSQTIEEHLKDILDIISLEMKRLAVELNMEHSQYPFRLDEKRLTVYASTPSGRAVMGQNLGSGSNNLKAHLIALLALHRYFIENNCPVPGLLVLDQPTQVYYPNGSYLDAHGNEQVLGGRDLEEVERMFSTLFEYCEMLYPNFQIIVIEHAVLDFERFQAALVEPPWYGGRALIPSDWLE